VFLAINMGVSRFWKVGVRDLATLRFSVTSLIFAVEPSSATMKVALPKCFWSGHSQAKCPDLSQFRHRFPFSHRSHLSLLMMGGLGKGFSLESFDSEGQNLVDVGVSGLGLKGPGSLGYKW
jgi:hypothetical protein